MKYRISKRYDPQKRCSDYKERFYLLEDENGRTLEELYQDLMGVLLMVMNYNELKKLIE